MLQYHLVENPMTEAPDDCMAQVVNVRLYTNEELAELMLHRGTLLTKADILAALEVYREVILDVIAEGDGVKTSLFLITPGILGAFDGLTDSFDDVRHRTHVNINPGTDIRRVAGRIKTRKVHVDNPVPNIVEVIDVVSGSTNDRLTPGGVMQLRGSRLKLVETNSTNGAYLLTEGGGEVKLTVIVENKPGRLIILLPADLAAGTYTLEIRTTYSTNRECKTLKTGRFNRSLTV